MAKRNDSLLNEIIARRRANQVMQQTDPLARVLDDLNVMDTLEALRRRAKLTYGPKIITSALPSKGVVLWQRGNGYYGYKTLKVLGVWAILRDEATVIVVGSKTLAFSAPFYETEAYHKLIKQNYDLYYTDDNRPPAQPSFSVRYDPEARLDLRETVGKEMARLAL